jgi:hypothetical protein
VADEQCHNNEEPRERNLAQNGGNKRNEDGCENEGDTFPSHGDMGRFLSKIDGAQRVKILTLYESEQ